MPASNAQSKGNVAAARGKQAKLSKTVVLKVASESLTKWIDDKDTIKPSAPPSSKSTSKGGSKGTSTASTPAVEAKDSPPSAEIKPEPSGANTPDPAADQPAGDIKKKGNGGPKAGVKRGAAALDDAPAGANKGRAKPGPKRRKIDGPIDESNRPWTTNAGPAGHKLGPKANPGAINAGLRALDRGGAPCRRWARRPFTVKSFTGVVWELPTWATPRPEKKEGEEDGDGDGAVKGEKKDGATPTSNSENNPPAPSSSNVGSEANGGEPGGAMSAAAASSPPAVATPA